MIALDLIGHGGNLLSEQLIGDPFKQKYGPVNVAELIGEPGENVGVTAVAELPDQG